MLTVRTPFRISFVGGGSDFSEYYSSGYGAVLSATINKYMYIVIHPYFHDKIRIKYSLTEDVNSVAEVKHPIVRECLKLINISKGLEIASFADVPAGTGLGSSSSFTVALLNALHTFKGENASKEQLAKEACDIEIKHLNEPIGKQDQYAAAYGGLNYIKFNQDGTVNVEKLKNSQAISQELAKNLILFFIGQERKASSILTEQRENTKAADKRKTIKKMVTLADNLKGSLENGKYDDFGAVLHEAWLLKKTLASGITNSVVDEYYDKALKHGAIGGKVLGAGGGGFLLMYCPPEKQAAVKKALGCRTLDFDFENKGSQVIFNN